MTDLEQELLKLVSDLRAENAGLMEIVLAQAGLQIADKEVVVPESQQHIGKVPWYRKKSMLERLYKTKASEITRVPEVSDSLSQKEDNG